MNKKILIILIILLASTTSFAGINFDGVDDQVTVASFPFLSVFTLSAWIRPTTQVDAYQGIITRGGVFDANTNYDMGVRYRVADTTYRIMFYYKDSTTLNGAEWCAPSDYRNAWHHVVGIYDGTIMKVYYDGVKLPFGVPCTAGDYTTSVVPTDGSQSLKIGSPNTTDSTDDPFTGQIDDVRIYNRALTEDEVLNIYKSRMRYAFPVDGLVGYFPLDENANGVSWDGRTAFNRSGVGPNGTGDNGANNTGLIAVGGSLLSYP